MGENGGRTLIRNCISQLNRIQGMDSGENRALYPVIIVFCGKEAAEQFATVQDTLSDNWQNADFLKYMNFVKTGETFSCTDLVSKETSSDPMVLAEKAVVEMLGTDEYVFEDKSRIRFAFIMTGEDEDAESYYDFATEMNLGNMYNVFKTIFVMMDESDIRKRRQTRVLLKHITETREKTSKTLGTIYLLSNFLKNGNYLLNQKLSLNYRLVADLVILGGNRGGESGSKAVSAVETYDTVKTAAYALVEKPLRNITIICLRSIMRSLMEENERHYRETAGDPMQAAERLEQKLGIQPGKIDCLERIFQDSVMRLFPEAEELRYLAYTSEQEHKDANKGNSMSPAGADRATGGNWTLFYQENYRGRVREFLEDEKCMADCMDRIEKDWRRLLDYGDARYGLEDGRVIKTVREFTLPSSVPTGSASENRLHTWAVAEARKVFYDRMLEKLTELLDQIHQDGTAFEKAYRGLEDELRREDIDDSKKDISSYYGRLTGDFLRRSGNRIAQEIFNLSNDGDKIIYELENVFGELIRSQEIFALPFEKEMQMRLNTMSDVDRILQITNVLETKIQNLVRLHWDDTSYEERVRGTYYLMNKDAEYTRELDGSNNEFTIFHLKRTDCIEKIAIYDIDKPGSYCDLAQKAGEA